MSEFDPPEKRTVRILTTREEEGRVMTSSVTPEICDFCADQTPTWDYNCADFVLDDPIAGLKGFAGGWAACEACSTYIEVGNRTGLADRATFGVPDGMDKQIIHARIKKLHELFFENRIGERQPHREGDMV